MFSADSVRVWVESLPARSIGATWFDLFLRVFLVALGAFLGAVLAFRWHRLRDKQLRTSAQIEAGRAAQFALLSQWDFLVNVQKQLAPFREDPGRWAKLLPVATYVTVPNLDTESISFLFISSDPDLPNRLREAEAMVQVSRGLLEDRNVAARKLQQRFEAHDRSHPGSAVLTQPQVEGIAGPVLSSTLIDITDGLYTTVELGIKRLEVALSDLRTVLQQQFPGTRFLDYRPVSSEHGHSDNSEDSVNLSYDTLYSSVRGEINGHDEAIRRAGTWAVALAGSALGILLGILQHAPFQDSIIPSQADLGALAIAAAALINCGLWVLTVSYERGVIRMGAYLLVLEHAGACPLGWEHLVWASQASGRRGTLHVLLQSIFPFIGFLYVALAVAIILVFGPTSPRYWAVLVAALLVLVGCWLLWNTGRHRRAALGNARFLFDRDGVVAAIKGAYGVDLTEL